MTADDAAIFELEALRISRAGLGEDPGVTILAPRLSLFAGDCMALVGPSGSGKTSILEILGLLTPPKDVERFVVRPRGATTVDIAKLGRSTSASVYLDRTASLRAGFVATVPQRGALLSNLNGFQNAALHPSLTLQGRRESTRWINNWARRLDVSRQLSHRPNAMSGGEVQRLALVRALAPGPQMILADEPTASLDPTLKSAAFDLLREISTVGGTAVVIATHDPATAAAAGFEIVAARSRRVEGGAPEHRFERAPTALIARADEEKATA